MYIIEQLYNAVYLTPAASIILTKENHDHNLNNIVSGVLR